MAEAADGVSLWCQLDGDGPPVVLIPGRGDSSDLFPDEFSDGLIAAGFAVVRIDPRDTGLSGDGGDSYRLTEMADDIVTVCDDIGIERAHLVAVSMGGMIDTDLAVRLPVSEPPRSGPRPVQRLQDSGGT